MQDKEPFDDVLVQAVVKEAKRRGLVANATCHYCGEVFVEQELDDVLAHSDVCEGRKND